MAARSSTMHIQARVRGDLESVVSWWTSPERREEQRARHEGLSVSDFRYEESLEDGQRVTETGWTSRRGLQVCVRTVTPVQPDGALERTPEGRAVSRRQTFVSRRWPDGREDSSRTESVLEFSQLSASRTRVRVTVTQYIEGVPRWGRSFPHHDERFHLRMHLKETIAKCEYHLGARKSAKPWFAVY